MRLVSSLIEVYPLHYPTMREKATANLLLSWHFWSLLNDIRASIDVFVGVKFQLSKLHIRTVSVDQSSRKIVLWGNALVLEVNIVYKKNLNISIYHRLTKKIGFQPMLWYVTYVNNDKGWLFRLLSLPISSL